jgi:hypothetical protein
MAEHEWTPFTEDVVICAQCGDTCDEAASKAEWEAECTPDDLLYAVGGITEEEADKYNGFTEGGDS